MVPSLRAPSRGLPILALALLAGMANAQAPAEPTAPASGKADNARALERCEASVVETLRQLRGNRATQDVQFVPAQRLVAPADEAEIGVKGAGRYRGAGAGQGTGTTFNFSCTFNVKTGLTSGVVLREAGGSVSSAAAREANWLPDLSRILPEVCESAVAQQLKVKHPRVAQIAMEPDTRRLQPGPDGHVLLLGQGAVQRAAGMNAVPFSYTCEIDARSGRVLGVQTSV